MISKYFKRQEFLCNCGCGMDVRDDLKTILDAVRERVGEPLILSSAARCGDYNKKIGGAMRSAHTLGLAADIQCGSSELRWKILEALFYFKVSRIEWGTPTWVHFDLATEKTKHKQFVCFPP